MLALLSSCSQSVHQDSRCLTDLLEGRSTHWRSPSPMARSLWSPGPPDKVALMLPLPSVKPDSESELPREVHLEPKQ